MAIKNAVTNCHGLRWIKPNRKVDKRIDFMKKHRGSNTSKMMPVNNSSLQIGVGTKRKTKKKNSGFFTRKPE